MSDVKAIMEEFQFGGIERIFICFFSYFIIGYLILFTIYENKFLNLNLHAQVLLAISISFPISTISAIMISDDELTEDDDDELIEDDDDELTEDDDDELTEDDDDESEFFYRMKVEFMLLSLYYSMMFSLFYIIKKLDVIHYDSKFDPVIGLAIILFFYVPAKLWKY